jgi:hypothetical protein
MCATTTVALPPITIFTVSQVWDGVDRQYGVRKSAQPGLLRSFPLHLLLLLLLLHLLLLLLLQVHQVCWKKLGPYNLKCRKVRPHSPVARRDLDLDTHAIEKDICLQQESHLSGLLVRCLSRPLALLMQPALIQWLSCLQVVQLKPQKPLQQLEPAQQQQQDGNEPVAMDTCTPAASSSGAGAAEAAVAAAAVATGSSDDGGPDAMQQDTPRPQGPGEAAAAAAAGHSGVVLMDASSSSSGARGGLYSQLQQQLSAGGGQPVLEYTLKFETQMYKLRDDEYSFDIQVGG